MEEDLGIHIDMRELYAPTYSYGTKLEIISHNSPARNSGGEASSSRCLRR